MNKYLSIDQVVKSISITHKFNKDELIFLNTSDVGNGKILNKNYFFTSELKGQAKKTIKKGDILFSEIRPKNRRFAYVDFEDTEDYVVSTKLMVLRKFNEEVDNKYFYYFLTNNYMLSLLQSRAENRICSFPQITFDLLSEYKIRVPSISDQQKIASILSSLDSKIELNNKINAELEKMAKTLYDYWFVQFDFPDENGKPYKSSGGKMVWSDELKREIPKNWSVKKLGDVCEIYQPQTISEKDCIKNGKYFVHGSNGIIGKYYKYNHKESEIIISCRGDCGNIHRTLPKTWITGNAMVFRMLDKSIYNEFLYQALRHSGIKNISSGSVQGQITRTNVSPLKIILPEKKIIDKFSKISKNIVSKKLLINEENQKLAELRDWLLPLLMNGQVKVK
jgi:type I restriction enzyme S subunit